MKSILSTVSAILLVSAFAKCRAQDFYSVLHSLILICNFHYQSSNHP